MFRATLYVVLGILTFQLVTSCAIFSNNKDGKYGDTYTKDPTSIVRSDLLGEFGLAHDIKISPQPTHESLQILYELDNILETELSTEEIVNQFYPKADAARFETAQGWYRFPYLTPMLALKRGRCETLTWVQKSPSKVQVDCFGSYLLLSPILGSSKEKMHLQFSLNKVGEKWFLSKGGLAHTQAFGFPEVNTDIGYIGLKIKSNFNNQM